MYTCGFFTCLTFQYKKNSMTLYSTNIELWLRGSREGQGGGRKKGNRFVNIRQDIFFKPLKSTINNFLDRLVQSQFINKVVIYYLQAQP